MNTPTPLIVSASRATDIPAFHMPWFMERLRAGYCVRVNPFNSLQRMRISFERCRVIVFWSKDPRPLLPHLPEIRARGFDVIIQFTLNDYEPEGLEPRVPPRAVRLETLARLADACGPERIVWRFDPLVIGTDLSADQLLERVGGLGRVASPYTRQLMFSFLTPYAKIRARLRRLDPGLRPPDAEEQRRLVEGIAAVNAAWPHPLRLAICAATGDFSAWGVEPGACIDPVLVRSLYPDDPDIAVLCGVGAAKPMKDSGQRDNCRCLPSRDVGAYSTCPHGCLYCYANRSEQTVFANLNRRESGSETLCSV